MGANSGIEWTHHTFNPWRGCTKVSQGCKHCYAETLSKRNPAALGVWGPKGQRVVAADAYWRQPLKWNAAAAAAGERHRVFCASLADVFEAEDTMPASSWPAVEAARLRLFRLIRETPSLDWLLLTKRPAFAAEWLSRLAWYSDPTIGGWSAYLTDPGHGAWNGSPLANVWIGTSVEDQASADERIPQLLQIPAYTRFLSCEPLLGPVDLGLYRVSGDVIDPMCDDCDDRHEGRCDDGIHWVIAGGESGGEARPMHPDWARSLRDQCVAAGVSFFFKQWGEYRLWDEQAEGLHLGTYAIVAPDGRIVYDWRGTSNPNMAHVSTAPAGSVCLARVGKKHAGRQLDGRTWDETP